MTEHDEREHQADVRRQFGASALGYVRSSVHASGSDLELLKARCEGTPEKSLLDVATGGGHTALALAPLFGTVVATDLTEEMLAAAEALARERGIGNVSFRIADAEALPFGDGAFDAVSCRIAPHHFLHPERFVGEAARVLKLGGLLLLEDSVVPEDTALADAFNRIERLRDPTHVRSLAREAWRRIIEGAGLTIEAEATDRKPHVLEEWMERSRTPEDGREEVRAALRELEPDGREEFEVTFDGDGWPVGFTDDKGLFKARKV